ncbi:conserved hypothetical protein [Hyella patelloides LEGE 07179]|uniref:PEP-CTERM sorting domain-containing protein n=1 Tax=Hyella patelloides LEGE 07179 TaxID=945734 RepID=A0A563VQ16_9CYAN|nr:hypothetical protein [Hyella patelloides]VEP13501.1 conserved hypothetical protein [Hyella patelloides LEGE 07179]
MIMSRNLRVNGIFGGSIAVLATVLGISFPANALMFTTYTDRATWQAAVGGTDNFSEENFNSFTTDTLFKDTISGLDVGEFTLDGDGFVNSSNDIPRIESAPLSSPFPEINVNNSTLVHGLAGGSSSSFFTSLTFDSPITAFGAEFNNVNENAPQNTQIKADGEVVDDGTIDSIPTIDFTSSFFGFTADGSFTEVEFKGTGTSSDGFGMDNVVYGSSSSASVPFEFSPTLGLLAVGGVLGVSRVRKRLATQKITKELS